MATAVREPRARDAGRSRAAILDAAERLFSERGFSDAGLGDIAAAAGLSRGTPSYFFGSKEELHRAVLERVFADRAAATHDACAALRAWARDGTGTLERALAAAVDGYLAFLLARPAFARLVLWEELAGAERLGAAARDSHALEEAFAAVRRVAPARGLRAFRVDDAVLLFVSLTYSPVTQRSTFMASLGRDLDDAATRRRHARLVVAQLLALMGEERR